MNSRERLMAILNKEKKADRFGWSPLIDGYFMSSFPPGKDIIDVFKELYADVMERHVLTWDTNFEKMTAGLASKENSSIRIDDNGVKVSTILETVKKGILLTRQYEIPGHVLRSTAIFTRESPFIPFPLEPLIKTPEDIEAYIYVKKWEKYTEKFLNFVNEDERIGENGIATDTSPVSPIQDIVQHLVGIEKFYTVFYTEYLSEIEKLMDVMHEKNLEVYELLSNSPASVVIGYENTSTTLVSPAIYEKYTLPCINDYADILHGRGKIYLTHRCGKLSGLLDLLKKGKDDGIVDISPAPTGDLNIWDAQEALPDKIVQGGLDPTILTQWSAEQVKDYVRLILNKTPDGGNVIIGTADATPKDAKVENLKAAGEVISNAVSVI